MTITKTSSYKIISCTKCFWLIPGTSKHISICVNMNNCMVAKHFNKPSETNAQTTTIIPGPCPLSTNPTAPATYAVPAIPPAAAPCAVPARTAPAGTMFTLKSLIPLTSTPETILQSPMLL